MPGAGAGGLTAGAGCVAAPLGLNRYATIGMTMVIIVGGIDLSVGSIVALSAVLSARAIRDFAGGANAVLESPGPAGVSIVVLSNLDPPSAERVAARLRKWAPPPVNAR